MVDRDGLHGRPLEAKLAAAAKAGFRAVEMFENDLTFFTGKARDARRDGGDLGLEIVALQPMRDFEAMPRSDPARAISSAPTRKFELMRGAWARGCCACARTSRTRRSTIPTASPPISPSLPISPASTACSIGYEALAWGRHVKDWTAAWEIVRTGRPRQSRHRARQLPHLRARQSDRADRRTAGRTNRAGPGRRRAGDQMDPLSLSRHYRCYPGQGDYPIVDLSRRRDRAGYRGPVSLEIFNDQFRGASAIAIALDGMRSLRAAGEALAAPSAQRGASRRSPTFAPLPPAPRSSAPSSSNSPPPKRTRSDLAALFEGLGFPLAGRHRSKEVDLYAQGDNQLVVNRERDGFAHAFQLLHGPSVCAMALRVDSVERRMERAQRDANARACRPDRPRRSADPGGRRRRRQPDLFRRRQGPELARRFRAERRRRRRAWRAASDRSSLQCRAAQRIPELVAVLQDGARASPRAAGRDRRSRTAPSTAARCAAPTATCASRSISPTAARPASRAFSTRSAAPAIQQIALSTDDIFAAVEAARARGVAFLPIPDNYYDDLATRFEIAPGMLDRMRALGVLYDRVKDGEFLHIYTRTFRDRFFFEIVQRRNYDLFGAANTPVRLAAQANLDDSEERAEIEFE